MKMSSQKRALSSSVVAAGCILLSANSQAQLEAAPTDFRGSASALLEEVVVTARKRDEGAQEVPLSISAFNSEQIAALKIRDLNDLTVNMPNVSLEDIGTARGTANFSIRGVGVNSSIPSIDPTVGVFVNGVYLGTNSGTLFDTFDLESLEVLRGPQGTLFGRNVTGGAVLVNTKGPSDSFELNVRTAVETGDIGGLNTYTMAAVGGPVTSDVGARAVIYYNDDEGQLENQFTGNDVLGIEQTMARGTVTWTPSASSDLKLFYEYQETDGDGPAAQSHTNGVGQPGIPINHDRRGFNLSIDAEGYQKTETNFFVAEFNQQIAFGDGVITAIVGKRDFESVGFGDIDAQPSWLLHTDSWLETDQTSMELRYSGTFFGSTRLTAGIYSFENEIKYHERRGGLGVLTGNVAPFLRQEGGGLHNTESLTFFSQVDHDLDDSWTLTAGINYSREEKDVKVASLGFNQSVFPNLTECNIVEGPACPFDFVDDESWSNWAPKLGVTYNIDDQQRIYGHWTIGYRSGGYNLRNTSTDPNDTPGPFDEEEVSNFEVGYKSTHDWGRVNVALFHTQIDDQQREVNLPSPTAGVVQLIRNTADTTISGLEVDTAVSLSNNLLLLASVGYIDAGYDRVRFDLNGDGVVDNADKNLDLPRAPEMTWSIGLTHDLQLGDWGYLTSRATWSYRDYFAYTDNNLGFVEEVDIVDAGLDFHSANGNWVFSIYGKNLLDEVSFGNDTQLPALLGPLPLGGTFAPVMPGVRYGVEITYNMP